MEKFLPEDFIMLKDFAEKKQWKMDAECQDLYHKFLKNKKINCYNAASEYIFRLFYKSNYNINLFSEIAMLYYANGDFEHAIIWLKEMATILGEPRAMLLLAEVYAVTDDSYDRLLWLEWLESFISTCDEDVPPDLEVKFAAIVNYLFFDVKYDFDEETFAISYPRLLCYLNKNKRYFLDDKRWIKRSIIELLWKKKITIFNGRRYILFGSGEDGEYMFEFLRKRGGAVSFFVDNNEEKVGNCLFGVPILSPSQLLERRGDGVILIASELYKREMELQLEAVGLISNKDFYYFWDVLKKYLWFDK